MTLHDAIIKLLEITAMPMTTGDIANELNSNKWYQKKDGTLLTAFQIHGRTKNYPHLFKKDGSTISLYVNPSVALKKPLQTVKHKTTSITDISLYEMQLINEAHFKSAKLVDKLIPANKCGLYCIRISDINKLPLPFKNALVNRKHDILYIGIAKRCLNRRLLNQELRIKGHGTFIRSIGAILGFRPIKGSLINKRNKTNYTFSNIDSSKIIKWINDNLRVNWIEFNGDFESIETALISTYNPILNISKNKLLIPELKSLRTECIKIANFNNDF